MAQFEVRQNSELPATPQQVWAAVATGPGSLGWLFPMEIEPWQGGAVSRGPSTVTIWDPPRELACHHDSGDGFSAVLEYRIEARDGGTVLRWTLRGIIDDGWQTRADAADQHVAFYQHTLGHADQRGPPPVHRRHRPGADRAGVAQVAGHDLRAPEDGIGRFGGKVLGRRAATSPSQRAPHPEARHAASSGARSRRNAMRFNTTALSDRPAARSAVKLAATGAITFVIMLGGSSPASAQNQAQPRGDTATITGLSSVPQPAPSGDGKSINKCGKASCLCKGTFCADLIDAGYCAKFKVGGGQGLCIFPSKSTSGGVAAAGLKVGAGR